MNYMYTLHHIDVLSTIAVYIICILLSNSIFFCYDIMLLCCYIVMLLYYDDIILICCYTVILLYYYADVLLCCNVAALLCCNVSVMW